MLDFNALEQLNVTESVRHIMWKLFFPVRCAKNCDESPRRQFNPAECDIN